jgi:malate dehydrogenase
MVDAILKDKHLIVPASAYMRGEYNLKDMFFGVPVQLGRNGIEKIIEYKLNEDEQESLNRSADAVRQTTDALRSLVNIN